MKHWITPDGSFLNPSNDKDIDIYDGESIAQGLTNVGLPCECVKTIVAPQITKYHFNLENIQDINKIKKPLKMLSATVHHEIVQEPSDIAHFSITIPNENRAIVSIRQAIMNEKFNDYDEPLKTCLGLDCYCNPLVISVEKMPHILIAGATGSGKSVLLNSMIVSLLMTTTPGDMKMIMIDPKKVEMSKYDGLPHLAAPIVKSHKDAVSTLENVCAEMDDRYERMAKQGVKKASDMDLPSIVVVIDELADLMLTSKYECEESIIRIAQLGRAAGIHLIIATQRPTVNVITGLIKSNIPCKIALQTSSIRDSITILDHKGAEQLSGKGDALVKLPDRVEEIRFQSPFVTDDEIEKVVNYWKYDSIVDV